MPNYPLEVRTFAQLISDFDGSSPEQLRTLNMINSIYASLPTYTQGNSVLVSTASAPYTPPTQVVVSQGASGNSIAQRQFDGKLSVIAGTAAGDATTLAQLDARILVQNVTNVPTQGTYAAATYYNGSTFAPYYARIMDLDGVTLAGGNNMLVKHYANGMIYAGANIQVRNSAVNVQELYDNRLFSQVTPSAVDVSATLTGAQLMTGLVTSLTAAAVNMTLPLGSAMETALSAVYGTLAVGDSFEVLISNIGPNGITLVTNTGWTIVGSTAISTFFYTRCLIRRTAANTYSLYRG